MATVRAVEGQIWRLEGFKVRILHPGGVDVRSDRTGMPGYHFERAMKNSANVRSWVERRFLPTYPGFTVEVLDASGRRVHGNTRLATVRDTYLDS
jgi:hypothetical protein